MKKNYIFYAFLFAIPVLGVLFISSASGMSGGYSGSPGDSNTTCNQCHSGGSFNAVASITSTIPAAGYTAGSTYAITVTASSTSTKHGFQLTAENSTGAKLGIFTGNTTVSAVNSSTAATHKSTSTNLTSWTVNWTAPATATTPVNFYVALNATNGNNTTTGDQVVTASRGYELLSNTNFEQITFNAYPNPAQDIFYIKGLDIVEPTPVNILNYYGQVVRSISLTSSQEGIDISNLQQGYYFIQIEQVNKRGITSFIKE